ncbi:MAG: 4-hydroxythreonine-4-phosphate dehydrogenase PdxA [Candidatus Omnitrophota bacterium]
MKKPIVLITLGDPGGIGPEIALRAVAAGRSRQATAVLIGGLRMLEAVCKKCRARFRVSKTDLLPKAGAGRGGLYFLDITPRARALYGKKDFSRGLGWDPGRVSKRNAAYAMAALGQAVEILREGGAGALVTAPVSKTAMRLLDPGFTGHTEFLAKAVCARSVAMMFVASRLKVTLATIHEPLRKVAGLLKPALVESKIRLTHDFLQKKMRLRNPRIGVCALNPHGRETGTEEDQVIVPAVRWARRQGWKVSGPYSADQLFYEAYQGRYDALIAMYHDQALAPFKMVHFREGVNVTLGLPFVRTSPDHGTAFDIAYRHRADAGSMVAAVGLAAKFAAA